MIRSAKSLKIGDDVKIDTPWVDVDFPNCRGTIIGLRHGGAVAVIETTHNNTPRVIHENYLR